MNLPTESLNPIRQLYLCDRNSRKEFLVDIGAVISVVLPTWTRSNRPANISLQVANGSNIKNFWFNFANFKPGNETSFPWIFIIADVRTLIIDADFLSHFNLIVDLKARHLIDQETLFTVRGKVAKTHSVSIRTAIPSNEQFSTIL